MPNDGDDPSHEENRKKVDVNLPELLKTLGLHRRDVVIKIMLAEREKEAHSTFMRWVEVGLAALLAAWLLEVAMRLVA